MIIFIYFESNKLTTLEKRVYIYNISSDLFTPDVLFITLTLCGSLEQFWNP